ncbi:MAG TPA: class I SAM-dependent methyltransferase [Smithellaceae bacterium]|nr:class I SAM-dependent methyltransferase [Smithellaceae bacterium]HRS83979.1 class I SAM-dependent methyltransferase [Smithellaceae bacterium]HRV44016.1 class I SAM-dependent methyltransferase [Smithellaceae bacterium]
MDNTKRNFDEEAARWDLNPARVKLASEIGRAILGEIPLTPDKDVLDFGCGTGLLTLALQPYVRSITGVDSSRGMLDVLNRKISERNLTNVITRYVNLDQGDVLSGAFHLTVSSMTLHHIRDVGPLLKQFHRILNPFGCLCIADLDEEGGRFHASNEGVFHFGFDRQKLAGQFEEAGFQNVRTVQAASVEKPAAGGMQTYTVFLTIGMK